MVSSCFSGEKMGMNEIDSNHDENYCDSDDGNNDDTDNHSDVDDH